LKSKWIATIIFSLIVTMSTPFLFPTYYTEKPNEVRQMAQFGAPFPFASQEVILPNENNRYPIEINFVSPFYTGIDFHTIPFILSFICFFLLFLSIVSVFSSFIKSKSRKSKKEV
jgi:hypothetical protein